MADGKPETVLVMDFGAQYAQLIARRVRECSVYSELVPHDIRAADVKALAPAGVILSGGPASVYEAGAPRMDPAIFELGLPVLGICYGHQLLALELGGKVEATPDREYGRAVITLDAQDALFRDVAAPGSELCCWMSHGDKVLEPPPGFTVTAHSVSTPVAAMANESRRLYGVQFHPEVAHTPFGSALLRAFVRGVCATAGAWTPGNFIADAVDRIRDRVGARGVVCGVSGGIDSCCVARLVHEAVGHQLHCIFVDTGLLRQGEPDAVRVDFAEGLGLDLTTVDAGDRFLTALAGVGDPEQKRKIIGREFAGVFEDQAAQVADAGFLAQGTLYPDVIESGDSAKSAVIKTHHNVGGLPKSFRLGVIEPLRSLFKDEARAVATELGVPDSIVWRHPFPGPGLAIRIEGPVDHDRLDIARRADAIFIEELHTAGLYRTVSQALAVLLSSRSVGVMGDQRTHGHPVVLRAVETDDFMTARWSRLPEAVLDRTATRIVNEVRGVNRVLYDVSTKPPATIEWE